MRHYWWKALPIPSNWKVAQEAFLEGYHVPATHPQLEPHSADLIYKPTPDAKPDFNHWNVAYETYAPGHGRFFGKKQHMKVDVRAPSCLAHYITLQLIKAMAARLHLLTCGQQREG